MATVFNMPSSEEFRIFSRTKSPPWFAEVAELPVVAQGETTNVDFILRQRSRDYYRIGSANERVPISPAGVSHALRTRLGTKKDDLGESLLNRLTCKPPHDVTHTVNRRLVGACVRYRLGTKKTAQRENKR